MSVEPFELEARAPGVESAWEVLPEGGQMARLRLTIADGAALHRRGLVLHARRAIGAARLQHIEAPVAVAPQDLLPASAADATGRGTATAEGLELAFFDTGAEVELGAMPMLPEGPLTLCLVFAVEPGAAGLAASWARRGAELERLQGVLASCEQELQFKAAALVQAFERQQAAPAAGRRLWAGLRPRLRLPSLPPTALPPPRLLARVLWLALTLRPQAALAALRRERLRRLVLDSGLFDEAWFLTTCPEAAGAPMAALDYYLQHRDRVSPGPEFDVHYYLAANPDVAASGADPLLHYLRFGRAEGRLGTGGLHSALPAGAAADSAGCRPADPVHGQ